MITDDMKILLEIQEKDQRLFNLNKQIRSVPGEKARIEYELQNSGTAMDEAKAAMLTVEQAIHTVEVEVQSQEDKIRTLQSQSLEVKKNDIYRGLMKEIDFHKKLINDLEEKELIEWENLETAKAQRLTAEKDLVARKQRTEAMVRDLEIRAKNCREQAGKITAERDAISVNASNALLRNYRRLIALSPENGEFRRGAVQVINDNCGGCNLKVTTQIRHLAAKGDLAACEYCGAILYQDNE